LASEFRVLSAVGVIRRNIRSGGTHHKTAVVIAIV